MTPLETYLIELREIHEHGVAGKACWSDWKL